VGIVSGGGTGTYNVSGVYPGVTEIQAGSYILMDVSYNERCPEFGCALTVLTTVVSVTQPQRRVVTDAGLKSMTKDFGMPGVKGYPDLSVMGLSEEHVRIEDKSGRCSLKVGDKIELIPNHVCTTVNLHDRFYGMRKGKVEAIWPIAARGRFD
jgi:D-serine deaminase-like pyridoxal phosphate-dependent protein